MRNDHHVVETGRPTGHHAVGIKRQLRPNSSLPNHPAKIKMKEFGVTRMTIGRPWTVEQDIQDRSTNREDVPRDTTTATYSDVTNLTTPGPNAAATRPGTEAPHTPYALPMR